MKILLCGFFIFISLCAETQIPYSVKKDVIQLVNEALSKDYIHPETAAKMCKYITKQLAAGKYDTIQTPNYFVNKLTEDLRFVSNDLHLSVFYSSNELFHYIGFETLFTAEQKKQINLDLRNRKYGLEKVEILPGNIGYLDFRFFAPLEYSGNTYAEAFRTLEDIHALIIDLRRNTGSMSDQVIPFITGYCFNSSVHINDIYFKKKKFTQQYWSNEYVPSKKFADIPIYVLTSGATFSGAEELAYDLKSLNRATIIGQNTAGAANPVASVTLNKHYGINLPQALVINPITGTNWEGVGVQVDSAILPILALDKAQILAIEKILSDTIVKDKTPLKLILEQLVHDIKPLVEHTFFLEGYATAKKVSVAGSFNFWGQNANLLARNKNGWSVKLLLPEGKYEYKFIIDGKWLTDIRNKQSDDLDGTKNSILIIQ